MTQMNLLICMRKKMFKVKLTELQKKKGEMRGDWYGAGKSSLCVSVPDGRKMSQ